VKHEYAQPVALKIGPDGLFAWDRAGSLLMQGRIAGCSQWSGRLLVLALAPDHGRSRTLLLAADALPAAVFRELAVLGGVAPAPDCNDCNRCYRSNVPR
jgi:hypothetical protein